MSARFTAREKMRAAQREVGYRRRVYARWVADGRMSQTKADEEIGLMDEIALEYGTLAQAERPQLPLDPAEVVKP